MIFFSYFKNLKSNPKTRRPTREFQSFFIWRMKWNFQQSFISFPLLNSLVRSIKLHSTILERKKYIKLIFVVNVAKHMKNLNLSIFYEIFVRFSLPRTSLANCETKHFILQIKNHSLFGLWSFFTTFLRNIYKKRAKHINKFHIRKKWYSQFMNCIWKYK